jgi:voltage-dependent potassium channel beta subunit
MAMTYRRLGGSGLKVSALSFGAWVTFGNQIGDKVARDLLHTAYEAGINFFDNAEGYAAGRAEEVMGSVLQESGWRRESYLVSSKVFFGAGHDGPNENGLSRKHVIEACHAALRRLRVDYLDLYFCHRPDPDTPIVETCRAMHDLVTQGKVLYWGTSEWSAAQIQQAYTICDRLNLHAPQMEQSQYNLLHRARIEQEYAPLYRERGLGTTIWSPLASGLLTGKYNHGVPADSRLRAPGMAWLEQYTLGPEADQKLSVVRALNTIATDLGVSLPRLSVAWCLLNPHVSTVILGASRVAQLQETLTALDVMPLLTPAVRARIDAAVGNVAS